MQAAHTAGVVGGGRRVRAATAHCRRAVGGSRGPATGQRGLVQRRGLGQRRGVVRHTRRGEAGPARRLGPMHWHLKYWTQVSYT